MKQERHLIKGNLGIKTENVNYVSENTLKRNPIELKANKVGPSQRYPSEKKKSEIAYNSSSKNHSSINKLSKNLSVPKRK